MSINDALKAINRLAVFNTVRAMNWNFGKGDLLTLQWSSLSGGTAVIKPYQMREERTPFSLEVGDNENVYVRFKNRKRRYRPDA